jgi:heptosyltransferase-2
VKIDKKKIKRILLITLTNIGDIILTTPVIAALKKEFPDAQLDIMVGPLGRDIFVSHPEVARVIIYDKHIPLQEKRRLIQKLKGARYDLVVDLRNTLFSLLIGPKYRTSPIQLGPKNALHKKDFHLWKLRFLGIDTQDASFSIHVTKEDQDYVDRLLTNIPNRDRLIAISPTAKSLIKRWEGGGFAKVGDMLAKESGVSLVMIGDKQDREAIDEIINGMESKPLNFAGLTSIPQLAALLSASRLLITNDSAPMHVGCAVGTNVLAIFGPTDPVKYGPRGKNDKIIKKDLDCSPCEVAQCKRKHECMKAISADEVYEAAKGILA